MKTTLDNRKEIGHPFRFNRQETGGSDVPSEVIHAQNRRNPDFGFAHHRLYVEAHESQGLAHWIGAHVQYSQWSPERFLRWAEEIGPHTAQLIAAVLDARQHPQQAYRSCLGILGLAKRYTNARLEAACRRALPAGIRSYKGLRNILENKLDQLERDEPPATPLPAHANIRGESY